ncbi:MAG: metallopeptidase family protein [Pseudomonadota bacterium]
MDWTNHTPPSAEDIATLTNAAIEALPEPYRDAARQVTVLVEDFAADSVLHEMQIDDPFEITGLYDGIPLTEKSVLDQPMGPDTIWLFRRPILDEWARRSDEALGHLVAHILVHELAHHFGWTDEQIAAIDRWWE